MSESVRAVEVLDRMTLDDLRGMDPAELGRFVSLLEHWRQLADSEQKRRRNEVPTD